MNETNEIKDPTVKEGEEHQVTVEQPKERVPFDWHDLFRVLPTNEERKDFVLVMGKSLATEKHFRNEEDAWRYARTPKWDTTMALFAEMIDIKFQRIHAEEMLKAEQEVKDELNNK